MLTNIICPVLRQRICLRPPTCRQRMSAASPAAHTFLVRQPEGPVQGLEIIDEPVKVSGTSTGNKSDVIDYEIFGTKCNSRKSRSIRAKW